MSQTRSKTVAEFNGIERILEEISEKISTLCSKYDNFTTAIRDMEELNRIFREEVQMLLSTRVTDSDRNDVLSCSDNYRTNVQEMVKHWSEINLEKETYEKKRELHTVWYKLLNQRKQAYWNAIKNENLADTYENWKNREQTIFPRKFRIKSIDSETTEETQIRANLALQRFETEIALLRLRVPKFKNKFENCDEAIADEISKTCSGLIAEKLQELWKSEVSREEAKSQQILGTKKVWFDEYEKNYGNEITKASNISKPNNRSFKNNSTRKQTYIAPRKTFNRSNSRFRSRTSQRQESYANAVKHGKQPQRGNYQHRQPHNPGSVQRRINDLPNKQRFNNARPSTHERRQNGGQNGGQKHHHTDSEGTRRENQTLNPNSSVNFLGQRRAQRTRKKQVTFRFKNY